MKRALAAMGLLGALLPAKAAAQAGDQSGVIWQGSASIGLADVAAIAAPVLWFASDEPLLAAGHRALPNTHPCDAPAPGGVVYYQLIRVDLRTGDRVGWPPQDDPFFIDRARLFTLRYHFYFLRDFGGVGRLHDLESLDVDIAVDQYADGRRLRIVRAAGRVRGTDWNANELVVGPGTRLPITVLVERGTHATAPDRNADGLFTLGHDINRHLGDAWGVRDIEVPARVTGKFDASMFLPRTAGYRVLPPDVSRNLVDNTPNSSVGGLGAELGRYEVRPASSVPECTVLPPEYRTLRGLMGDQQFGPDFEPEQFRSGWMRAVMRPFSGTNPLIRNVSVRRDRSVGAAILFRGADFLEGSLMPRLTFASRLASLEGLFTPTSTRFLNWYVSAGVAQDRRKWAFTAEGGLKFLVRVPNAGRKFSLGSEFAGLRFGVRTTGFDRLQPIRFVVEIGIGAW